MLIENHPRYSHNVGTSNNVGSFEFFYSNFRPTSTPSKVTVASRQFDQIFPSPSTSEPRLTQMIYQMPSTPLMNVFDPAPNLYNSSESAIVDDILVGAVVNLKPAYPLNSHLNVHLPLFSSLTESNASEFTTMIKTIGAFANFEERQRCLGKHFCVYRILSSRRACSKSFC